MRLRPGLVRGAVLSIAWVALFMVCLYAFFPVRRINTAIDRSLATQGLTLTPTVRKTILPGLAWDNALLSSEQGPLIRLERLAVRPLLLRLLTGRLELDAAAIMGRGHLGLDYVVTGSPSVRLTADGLELGELPLFKTVLGARVGGALKGEGHAESGPRGWNGELKLEISRLEFTGIRMGAFALPDAAGLRSRGMVRITDGRARLESFTLEGEGLYMRLSGEVPAGLNAVSAPLSLVLEIMPKPEFLEKQKLVFVLLSKFMASPGVYRVPITGTLLKPQIL
jgi:type II secretion system protein N